MKDVDHDAFPNPAPLGFGHVIVIVLSVNLSDNVEITNVLQREEADVRNEDLCDTITK